ncbi:uncharacterized protein BP01DRAFT_393833 [Aspergillus saccharolyticus JOP 1030-1]|uniref:Uncharacterized protein n=1 Tax=Aspergillus saccharolyticus JOP 1030-1 TaxID=1450539 RepID=A0A318Z6R5_9EURO|nr:hypothetical protein BP01DRAFT_393833 [Aspergillus saccharolyticus JOP 1030-1]PYH42799.1 hypothetical protein BP01DRAFT_393833 [Aspergillus saccharolyticus JOP 1030-1]
MYLRTKVHLRWRKQTQWPPAPSVEDETVSLSRELHGMTKLGENPGQEGVCSRGTVDQLPVIVDVLSFSSVVQTTVYDDSVRESGSDDNAEPSTPLADIEHDPMLYIVEDDQPAPLSTPWTSSDKVRGPRNSSARSEPTQNPSKALNGRPKEAKLDSKGDSPPKKDLTRSSRNGPMTTKTSTTKAVGSTPSMSPSNLKRADSAKPIPSAQVTRPLMPKPGHLSDSAAMGAKGSPIKPSSSPTGKPSNGPTLAERIEEKLRQRQELRASQEAAQNSDQKSPPPAAAAAQPIASLEQANIKPSVTCPNGCGVQPSRQPTPPKSAPTTKEPIAHEQGEEDPFSASFTAALAETPERPAVATEPAARSQSSDTAQSASSQTSSRRSVSFLDDALQRPVSPEEDPEDVYPAKPVSRRSSSQGAVRRSSPKPQFFLSPCPRSVPVAGYQDWHTVKGMSHLDICPSCLKQMRKSRFRDLFVLASPRPRDEKVRCSMSEPWTRLAWMQTQKKHLDHLDLLLQITRPPPGSKPCPGRIISEQHWYRVVDPDTNMFLPQFNVCHACVRNLRVLMPRHRETFKRSATKQERACDFVTDSARFVRYIDCLDMAANRAELEHAMRPDVSEFLSYARRKVVLRDCRRDRQVLSTWHYMSQLPELTVCEDCYDDVVWPLVKAKQPIARKFSTTMRLLPGEGPSRCREASCQLYSPRMRMKFQEAVQLDDLTYLKLVALRRREAEQRYRDRQAELLEAASQGYDVENELRKNVEEWKRWE